MDRIKESYLVLGPQTPALDDLKQVARALDAQPPNPETRMFSGAAFLDLASHPDTDDQFRPVLVGAASKKLLPLEHPDQKIATLEDVTAQLSGRLYLSFCDFYAKAVTGARPDLDDMHQLQKKLLSVGQSSLLVSQKLTDSADPNRKLAIARTHDLQFEIGAHLLNIRFNLGQQAVKQFSRQALPREAAARRTIDSATTWNVGFSYGDEIDFLSQDSLHRVRFIGNSDSAKAREPRSPDIAVVFGTEMGLSRSSRIIEASLKVAGDENLIGANRELDEYEKYLNTALGWEYNTE